MALSPTVTSLCNQLRQKYGGVVNPAKSSKSIIKSRIRRLISELEGASFGSFADLQNEVFALRTKVNGVIPGSSSSDVSEIRDFLANCPLFDTDFTAVSATRGSTIGIFDRIDEFVFESADNYDEFGLAAIADSINKLLNGANFPGGNNISRSLGDADILIQCLSNLCPDPGYSVDIIEFQNEVDGLYDELHIVGNPLSPNYGQLDYDYVYGEAGVTPTQISNVNYVIDEITNIKIEANTAIDNAVHAIKNSNRGGFV